MLSETGLMAFTVREWEKNKWAVPNEGPHKKTKQKKTAVGKTSAHIRLNYFLCHNMSHGSLLSLCAHHSRQNANLLFCEDVRVCRQHAVAVFLGEDGPGAGAAPEQTTVVPGPPKVNSPARLKSSPMAN